MLGAMAEGHDEASPDADGSPELKLPPELAVMYTDSPGHHVLMPIRELSNDELADLAASSLWMNLFLRQSAFRLVKETYDEFTSTVSQVSTAAAEWTMADANRELSVVSFRVSGRLMLWLEAARLFLNQTEADLKTHLGPVSEEWSAWEAAKSEVYDRSFAYRLMYALRNRNHAAPPGLTPEWTLAEDRRGEPKASIEFSLSRERSLSRGNWKAEIRRELEGMPDRLPLMPLALECQNELTSLLETLAKLQLPYARRGAEFVRQLHDEVMATEAGTRHNAFAIQVQRSFDADGTPQIPQSPLPMEAVRAVERLLLSGQFPIP